VAEADGGEGRHLFEGSAAIGGFIGESADDDGWGCHGYPF
jgi:hypothetical protein